MKRYLLAWFSCISFSLTAAIPAPDAAARKANELRAAHASARNKENERLRELAASLEKAGETREAKAVRDAIRPLVTPSGATRIVPLVEIVPGKRTSKASASGLANLPERSHAEGASPKSIRSNSDDGSTGVDLDRIKEWTKIRREAAAELFDLAKQAFKTGGRLSLASLWLHEVIERDPDHAEARRILGFVPYEGGWATPYAIQMIKSGKALHPRFGWVDRTWIDRLNAGELPAPIVRGAPIRWVSAAEADAARSEWENGWKITTEHFVIQSNLPLSEVIVFGRRLEAFRDVFITVMADVIGPAKFSIARRFADPKLKPTTDSAAHKIFYFATKTQYLDYLKTHDLQADSRSLGIYIPGSKICFFYKNENGAIPDTATLYHETSHQLLFELAGKGNFQRNPGDFWVFEGLGTYFETVEVLADDSIELGGMIGPRIAQALERIAIRGEIVPLDRFVKIGAARFVQPEPNADVYLKYVQAMALTVFLMRYDGERYRDAFLDYVEDAYKGRLTGQASRTLTGRLGVPYDEIEAQFVADLKRFVPRARDR
jgi:hypothetical protein